ncbi:hypothetical protein DPMN_179126 [Dreissena polymorpha]|uniref:Uncharacterized protein n=1 Tax=Dreissena polymorpha TaxID=45954 RepID=A0A9D4IN80_DREPO|nr:hypothetical protein DPMN_179126 [Dreissena polymorpha]
MSTFTHVEHNEKNTKNFANIEKRRSEQITIHKLVVNGEDITNRTQILEEQRLFFETLYKRKHVENNTLFKKTHHALNEEEKILCDGLLNEYECGLALKEMQNKKCLRNVNARVFTNQCGRTDSGQRPILKPHLSNQCSITRKTAPPPWQPYIYKTNLFTKFHDDWAKNVTSRVHVIQLTGTIFQLNSRIKETNVLTKFQENWAKNVTSRVFTCFHYIHIEKNVSPTGGHVFLPIWTIFELVRHINKTNVLINFHDDGPKLKTAPHTGGHLHEDWALNVTSTVFELDRDIIGTNLLTKFHVDQTINVASRVLTNKCGRMEDGQRPVTKAQLSKQTDRRMDRQTDGQKTATSPWQRFLIKFHENWAKKVTYRVLTCFHYIHIEKNAPPTGGNENLGGHVFQRTGTTFELNQHIITTNILTNFELARDFIGTSLLTKFHEDRTLNVASRVFTNK